MSINLNIFLWDGASVTVTGDGEKEVVKQAAFWSALPTACPVCGAGLRLTYREPNGKFAYYGLRCAGAPSHEADFGQHTDGEGLFYKERGEWRLSKQGAKDDGAQQQKPAPAEQKPPDETPAAEPPPPASTGAQVAPAAGSNPKNFDRKKSEQAIRELWKQERDLGGAAPKSESARPLDKLSDDELIRLGQTVRARVKALADARAAAEESQKRGAGARAK